MSSSKLKELLVAEGIEDKWLKYITRNFDSKRTELGDGTLYFRPMFAWRIIIERIAKENGIIVEFEE